MSRVCRDVYRKVWLYNLDYNRVLGVRAQNPFVLGVSHSLHSTNCGLSSILNTDPEISFCDLTNIMNKDTFLVFGEVTKKRASQLKYIPTYIHVYKKGNRALYYSMNLMDVGRNIFNVSNRNLATLKLGQGHRVPNLTLGLFWWHVWLQKWRL